MHCVKNWKKIVKEPEKTDVEKDDPFVAGVVDELGRSEADVPAEVSQRLVAARREAVAAFESRQPRQRWFQWGALGAVSAGILVLAVFLQSPVQKMPYAEETELIVAQEAELLEDLEFVAWVVAMEESGDEPHSG